MITPASAVRSSARALVVLAGASLPAFLAALPGCARDREIDPDAAEKLVVQSPGAGSFASPADDVAAAEHALAEAEAAWQAGDPLSALAIANQALRRGVPPEIEPRLRALRARARGAVLASRVVQVRVVPLADVVASGDPVPVRVLFRNLTATPLSAPRTAAGSSDALLVLEVRREDLDIFGNRRTSDFTVRAPLPEDLVVPPGGEREVQVSIAADLVRLEHEGITIVEVGGSFRPVLIRVGETEIFDAVPVAPAGVRVLAQGYEPLAEDPLASLRKAIAKQSPSHVMTCAELLAPADRDAAREALREGAARDAALAPYLKTVLARLDEIERPPRRAETSRTAPLRGAPR